MSSTLLRLRALFLAVVFLAGGGSVPVLDAALFHHRSAEPHELVVHVEGADASHHADSCALDRVLPVVRLSPCMDAAIRPEPVCVARTSPRPALPPAGPRPDSHHSRAPPVRSV